MCGTAGISMFSSIPKKGLLDKHRAWLRTFPSPIFHRIFCLYKFPTTSVNFCWSNLCATSKLHGESTASLPLVAFQRSEGNTPMDKHSRNKGKMKIHLQNSNEFGRLRSPTCVKLRFENRVNFRGCSKLALTLCPTQRKCCMKNGKKQQRTDRTAPKNMKQDEKNQQNCSSFFCRDSVDYILRSRSSQTVSDLATSFCQYACCDWMTIIEALTQMITSKNWL